MTGGVFIPRASLSERLARLALRLALGTVGAVVAGGCLSLFAVACGLLSFIR
jgi:hypothetical protein